MDLIDREVYRRQLQKSLDLMSRAGQSQSDIADGMRRALRLVDMQDEIDAVPVVRCGDCKYRTMLVGRAYYTCSHSKGVWGRVKETDFCSYGERREQE
jgi:hypothetical protein